MGNGNTVLQTELMCARLMSLESRVVECRESRSIALVDQIGPARFRAPEVLFRPDLIGEEYEGLHEVLLYAIQKSDMDLRKVLFQNIVLSGGSTLFKGFGDKLLSEVRRLAPKDIKIRISAPQERLYSTWIGGSILASLDTFKRMWVSKREFDEEGRRAIHRKTF